MDFKIFKAAIAKQFELMARHQLFRADVEKDALWDAYLAAFPPGSNPIFRERTDHDCQCCKGFIRAVGNAVAVIDGKIVSVWDAEVAEPSYQIVAGRMAELVKSRPIANTFMHFEGTAGTDRTLVDSIEGVTSFTHFFVNLPRQYVSAGADIATALNKTRTAQQTLKRALDELTDEAVTTVLDLISQNALYRGDEFKPAVQRFQQIMADYKRAPQDSRATLVWTLAGSAGAVAHIRNSAIGTLLVDLSDGMELEDAVKRFETSVMAPSNYKRPTALVSKAMIEKAKAKIEELGLGSALERRYATIEDITVNNILFGNRSARKSMKADVFDDMAANVPVKHQSLDKVEDVPIAAFIADILPRISTMEVMVENRHVGNLVSLVAPADATAKPLFKWDNGFSWSYNGDVADSIKERVKKAGGNVEGDLCCRLAWDYTDDLDFHMKEPGGHEIYFGCCRLRSPCGGMLDVDANGRDGLRPDPAENIFYADKSTMLEGMYRLDVNNYNRRSDGRGFEVEIEFGGVRHNIIYEKALRTGERITVAQIRYSRAKGIEIVESMPSSQSTKTVWSVATQTFVPVNVLMLSPNYWDEKAVGNKHWFFMLDGCRNDGHARGFFNEFLTEDLTAHRKVIEVVGSKLKTEQSDSQLSGLGFSSTARNSVLCKVTGSFSRVINLVF